MPYQIDVLAAGSDAKSADAICLRYGTNLDTDYQSQTVVVIDGGYSADGETVIQHVRNHYKSDRVDILISTHPDADHVGGLARVLEEMEVGELWMHLPWESSTGLADLFSDGRVTDSSLGEKLRDALNGAHKLFEIAEEKGVPIKQPFVGCSTPDECLIVVGPSEDYYSEQMLQILEAAHGTSSKTASGLAERAISAVKSVLSRVLETLHIETLTDDGETSPQNSSSTVILFRRDSDSTLFTGDASIEGLTQALDRLDGADFDLRSIKYMVLPHHGSKRNIGPSLLNRIFGSTLTEIASGQKAVVSAAPKAEKHPSKRVLNAVHRRGGRVWVTAGTSWMMGNHSRSGWNPQDPEPFHGEFEE